MVEEQSFSCSNYTIGSWSVITAADLFMEFAILPLLRLMAMDLLQLTVLALNLATDHSTGTISGFVCDRIPGALSPLFGWIVFLLCVFHLNDIHFSSRRAGSDKLMSLCDGGICIFIRLNKREMSSGALRILLCDRNHIIDWHTESCPSNSPWRGGAASDENKGRFEADRVSGQTVSRCSSSKSLCVSATLRRSVRWLKQWGRESCCRIPSGSTIPHFQVQQMSFMFF